MDKIYVALDFIPAPRQIVSVAREVFNLHMYR